MWLAVAHVPSGDGCMQERLTHLSWRGRWVTLGSRDHDDGDCVDGDGDGDGSAP